MIKQAVSRRKSRERRMAFFVRGCLMFPLNVDLVGRSCARVREFGASGAWSLAARGEGVKL